jgi:hypothetical protein
MHRAHADDLSRGTGNLMHDPAPAKFAHRCACAQELAAEIDRQHLILLLERHAFGLEVAADEHPGCALSAPRADLETIGWGRLDWSRALRTAATAAIVAIHFLPPTA